MMELYSLCSKLGDQAIDPPTYSMSQCSRAYVGQPDLKEPMEP